MEDAHSLIIDVEKILEVREGIGGAHLLHRSEGDGDLVALRELEHQFGFERPFDMEVQLGFGQRRDERGARLARGETVRHLARSEEHTSELQSLMRISYAVFCLKKKKKLNSHIHHDTTSYNPASHHSKEK